MCKTSKKCAILHRRCDAKDDCPLLNKNIGGAYRSFLYGITSAFAKVTKCSTSAHFRRYSQRCDDRVSLKICELALCEDIDLISKGEERKDSAPLIILILESPDVKEYKRVNKKEKVPKPARGRTGKEIMKRIVGLLNTVSTFHEWRIALINPIQYSCSFGGLLSSRRKNDVFATLFTGDIVECFKRRLNAICCNRDYVILNCCTTEGRDEINKILDSKDISFLSMSHPSSWRYLKDKKLQCRVNGKGKELKLTVKMFKKVIVRKEYQENKCHS